MGKKYVFLSSQKIILIKIYIYQLNISPWYLPTYRDTYKDTHTTFPQSYVRFLGLPEFLSVL